MQAAHVTHTPDVRSVMRASRQDFLERFVDLQAWKKLALQIKADKPKFVILQARRMPRLWQLLRGYGTFDFPATFVSDFAIKNIAHGLSGQRVALIDDAVNVGSTLSSAMLKVKEFDPEFVHCYAIARKQGGGLALRDGDITYGHPDLSEDDYRKTSTGTALALWLLNRPFECEFPVYRFIPHANMPDWPLFLTEAFGENSVHRLDIEEASFMGLARFSVDLRPGTGINDKLRIYEDKLKGETIIVPMANVAGDIEARYLTSQKLMREFEKCFSSEGKLELDREETELLFGTQKVLPEAQDGGSYSPDDDFMLNHWPRIEAHLKGSWSLYECFYNFFKDLGEYVGVDKNTVHERLHIGPTFSDLLQIIGILWENSPSTSVLHGFVSQLLDEQIDRGFVVPQCNTNNNRIFRKGEPYGNDINLAQTLRSIGIPIDSDEDAMLKMNSLDPDDKKRVERIVRLYQTMRISGQLS